MIKGLSQRLAAEKSPESGEASKIAEMINKAIEATRNIARVLNPIDLEMGGLQEGLRHLAVNTQRLFNIRCSYKSHVTLRLNATDATNLFAIAQEAVYNAVKHGRAKQIQINISKRAGQIQLKVEDDGRGIRRSLNQPQGMGISNMTYRARALGGQLSVSRGRNGGTNVICLFPQRSE